MFKREWELVLVNTGLEALHDDLEAGASVHVLCPALDHEVVHTLRGVREELRSQPCEGLC